MSSWRVVLLTVALAVTPTNGQASRAVKLRRNRTLDDVIFTDSVSFDVSAHSALDCARQCVSSDSCTTFTYHMTSCRGHSEVMTSAKPTTVGVGARSYLLHGEETAADQCPASSGFSYDGVTGLCYMAGTMGVDYYTSLAACQAMGASLLTLDSPEKVQALQDAGLFPAIPVYYYLGLRRPAGNSSLDDYVWTRTGLRAVDTFNYFNQAMAHYTGDCITITYFVNTFLFQDLDCGVATSQTSYICEMA